MLYIDLRNRIPIVVIVLLLGFLGVWAVGHYSVLSGKQNPDVVFIVLESVRADHLPCYDVGHIDELYEMGEQSITDVLKSR